MHWDNLVGKTLENREQNNINAIRTSHYPNQSHLYRLIVYGKDRSASPKMQEVKHLYQSFDFDLSNTQIRITNRHPFANSSEFACVLTLHREGKCLEELHFQTEVAPLETSVYPISFMTAMDVGEYCVDVSLRLKNSTLYAKAGYEIAYAQTILGDKTLLYRGYDLRGSLSRSDLVLVQSPHVIGVKNEEFEILFSRIYGGIIGYKYANAEMLEAIPKMNFLRAPTDNDRGNQMPFRYAKWKNAGRYQSCKRDLAGRTEALVERLEDSIRITFSHRILEDSEATVMQSYTISPDGMIEVQMLMEERDDLGDMPEFGMMFMLDADYRFMQYYGLGSDENYADRKHGARLGVYRVNVEDNLSAYLKPQECGNREGVRYAAIVDERNRGLFFRAKSGESMSFSALHYSPAMLEAAAYAHELPKVQHTFVRVAKARMGVGGDDSWGARTHEEFLLPKEGRMEFTFCFRGI